MRKMFLVLSIMLAVITTQASLYAIEVSVGISAGLYEHSIFRGSDADKFSGLNDFSGSEVDIPINIMVEFLPFLALETGIGYSYTRIMDYDADMDFSEGFSFDKGSIVFFKHGFTIPLMLRGQYEFNRVLVYGSVGPKLFIPISDYVYKVDPAVAADFFKNSNFSLDLGFALGVEFRVGDANYLGLKVGYDLNLISPLKSIGGKENPKFYNDDAGVSLTYRYAFGSKWKK